LFHPYYDAWDQFPLLRADINISTRVDVTFRVVRPARFPRGRFRRVQKHFEIFALRDLYSMESALELVQRKEHFRITFLTDGSAGLRNELLREAESRSKPFLNAWQPALYRTLAASAAFCGGDFGLIEE
jgi:hypothetical protein